MLANYRRITAADGSGRDITLAEIDGDRLLLRRRVRGTDYVIDLAEHVDAAALLRRVVARLDRDQVARVLGDVLGGLDGVER